MLLNLLMVMLQGNLLVMLLNLPMDVDAVESADSVNVAVFSSSKTVVVILQLVLKASSLTNQKQVADMSGMKRRFQCAC